MPDRNTYAAVDLGSNSFHMIVARLEHGQLRAIDNIKEMVRLAAGLDGRGRLKPEVRDRALDCLSRFRQRLAGIPDDNVRAVGTQTIRRLQSPQAFLVVAETALGAPIDIISGREEARLVYLGVCHDLAEPDRPRLVVDIGGASTEFIVGTTLDPELAESLPFGCVTISRDYFADGRITLPRWTRARRALQSTLQEIVPAFREVDRSHTIGSSGSNRAILNICRNQNWCDGETITDSALTELKRYLIEAGDVSRIDLAGLSPERLPVITGATLILETCFETLNVREMSVSPHALREGLLYDLLGRREHSDPRDQSIRGLAQRYRADSRQAERVRDMALAGFEQVAESHGLNQTHRDMLEWVALVHETGLAIAHGSYQTHSAYLLAHSDLPGFTRQEQAFLAAIAGNHRGQPRKKPFASLPGRLHSACRVLLVLLRLAVVFSRSRQDQDLPDFSLRWPGAGTLQLAVPETWSQTHPLTTWGLEQERRHLERLGLTLEIVELPADHTFPGQ